MSNLQIIEMLCALIEKQAGIICHLVMELEQARCLSDAERQMVDGAEHEYSAILGSDEWPDKK